MNKLETYAEWVNCFEQFKAGTKDEETILLMEQGQIEWTKGVAERLTQQLYETIDHRLRRSSDQLQREINTCNGNETALVKAILSARKRLAVLKRVAHLPAFPEQVRETMWNLLHDYAKSTQQSLEDSAVTDRTGRMRSLIRNNPITQFDQVENVFGSTPHAIPISDATGTAPKLEQKSRKRRVILP
ncbi:hypothetical protein RRV45_10785 [Bacillus sp. DTU_2020_1000418_1_SI_GHA_SEK_038]|uniref:hypothetical protein n=1 Tax=Bacillus sp. DTU_2020_1000418_1_SI_GHA_SEK_038 TaxID=3077585 RepID=UPI0028F02574|nr:hypothetical protein [Bacillus sp. DTU_2020_1000418_1_SI_GHA_SEK_038]WNS77440.1 hypothetical protein RRV45_10785 [Bacillus sp. DTU_2020_1000418_1_SI_GHA_SEK_038]